ncbi:aldo/keto reductase [Micromonospora sp. WMMD1128]|uniref:aldo/keto reductase n=1 Tax=Micromonospora sp. WMMD1128 TaxID=3015150 RepID=UPI00248B2DA5|nr:aldo/keto reductase [Micromonospora sp. WMMD1128]WBB75634.1 aldo/keto reductase [Micromonospora sp. WMMD1128]
MTGPATVLLGDTGVRAPRVVLGTATFGAQCDEATSRDILDRALERGMSWLDTATSYPLGSGADAVGGTEELLGRWLPGRRDQVFLATKVYNRTGPAPWQLGLSRKHLLAAVDGSLARLGTDHIDLLQLHRYDRSTPIEETLAALDTLVRAGKVRYVGCCNFLAYQLARALTLGELAGLPRLRTAQLRYSLVRRGAEIEAFRLCREQRVAVLAFNLLAGGVLTGRYDRNRPPPAGSRFAVGAAGRRYTERYWTDATFATVDALSTVAARAGSTLAVLATAWGLRHPDVTAPIVGVSRVDQLDAVTDALELELPDDVWTEVDRLTAGHRHQVEDIEFESS